MAHVDLKSIFHELRRRRVFNTVAIYIVGAWVTLQASDLAFPALGVPESAIRFVWTGAFLLFPLVLIFGWRYDISTGGIKRTAVADAAEDADTSLYKIDHGIIGVLSSISIVVVITMGVRISQVEQALPIAAVENSIAVLPFNVCEDRVRDQTLAGGLTMEVISRLAERGRLKVIARASSLAFAGHGLSIQQIARPLGVQYLLAGEVCREEGLLSLSAELFDERGFIVWSGRYTQAVNQWEQISERLASMVAAGVAAELGDGLAALPDLPVNKQAYEQLLIGREYLANFDADKALTAFELALDYQPDYAEALFEMALLEIRGNYYEQGSAMEKAKPIADRALALANRQLESNMQTAETLYTAGSITLALAKMEEELIWRQTEVLDEEEIDARKNDIALRYKEAERHFRAALGLNPSMIDAYYELSFVIEGQGQQRDAEALEILEQAQIKDPFNLYLNSRIAKHWVARGRYRQAIELLDRFRKLPEIPALAWGWQLELMKLNGYLDERCETLIEMLLHDPNAFDRHVFNRWQAWWFVSDLAELGLLEEAQGWKERIENIPLPDQMYRTGLNHYLEASGQSIELYEETMLQLATMSNEEILDAHNEQADVWAWTLAEAGEYERAIELLESIRHAPATWAERETSAALGLTELYQKAGYGSKAAPLLKEIVTYLEMEIDSGIRHPQTLSELAWAYELQGREDEALEMLRKAVDYHYVNSYKISDCVVDSDSIEWLTRHMENPRAVALCKRLATEWQQQADRVRGMLAEHDTDELLAPLMALAKKKMGSE